MKMLGQEGSIVSPARALQDLLGAGRGGAANVFLSPASRFGRAQHEPRGLECRDGGRGLSNPPIPLSGMGRQLLGCSVFASLPFPSSYPWTRRLGGCGPLLTGLPRHLEKLYLNFHVESTVFS